MQKSYNGLSLPTGGEAIQYADGKYQIPDHPIIPFIEGDGTGRDIWRASQRVFDAAVEKAYGGKRSVKWFEIFAGEKAYSQFNTWLPDDSVNAARDLFNGKGWFDATDFTLVHIEGSPAASPRTWRCTGPKSTRPPGCSPSSLASVSPTHSYGCGPMLMHMTYS